MKGGFKRTIWASCRTSKPKRELGWTTANRKRTRRLRAGNGP